MKYLSLFSGIGGFELGIQQAYEKNLATINREKDGRSEADETNDDEERERLESETWEDIDATNRPLGEYNNRHSRGQESPTCIGFSEVDKYATQIYQKHFNHKNYGDITKINEAELPEFDLLVGGFPCQAFSIAGKRGGFNDTRGTLFFDIARILKTKQPRLLLLENVKGLLSHDEGRTFATIIATLDELGYDLQWQVLNSKNFGVPQNRERVFIVGHLRGTSRPKVFPIGKNGDKTDVISRHIANTLTARYEGAQATGTYIGESQLDAQEKINDIVESLKFDGLEPTEKGWQSLRQIGSVGKDSEASRVYSSDGIARTIKNGGGMGAKTGLYAVSSDMMKIRRLTPKECERLQGFPDGWTEGVSDTQRYKTLGNAITVNVIEVIIKRLVYGGGII